MYSTREIAAKELTPFNCVCRGLGIYHKDSIVEVRIRNHHVIVKLIPFFGHEIEPLAFKHDLKTLVFRHEDRLEVYDYLYPLPAWCYEDDEWYPLEVWKMSMNFGKYTEIAKEMLIKIAF